MTSYKHYPDALSETNSTAGHSDNSNDDQAPPLYTSRPSTNRSARRSQPTAILGSIDENGGMAPDIPIRSMRRPVNKLFTSFFPSSFVSSRPPPEDPLESLKGPNGEKFTDMRNNTRHQRDRRAAWRKLICIICIVVIITALVAIGLVVGLTRKKGHNSNSNQPSTDNATLAMGFPVGSWAVTTYLSTVATDCTPNPATWRCYPYQTYSQSNSGSQAMLDWIISGEKTGSDINYKISSGENIFAPMFANASLVLQNKGASNEAYHFSVPVQLVVVPDAAITDDGSTTQCFYNNTILTANLYTKKDKTYPNSTASSLNDGEWAHAVDLSESIQANSSVPTCYKTKNGVLGAKVDLGSVAASSDAKCSCQYLNYGT